MKALELDFPVSVGMELDNKVGFLANLIFASFRKFWKPILFERSTEGGANLLSMVAAKYQISANSSFFILFRYFRRSFPSTILSDSLEWFGLLTRVRLKLVDR